MQWQKPSFITIHMTAEIGAYQDEFEGEVDRFYGVTVEAPSAGGGAASRDVASVSPESHSSR